MLAQFLTNAHRDCDAHFTQAEAAASDGDLDGARAAFTAFDAMLIEHLSMEEEVLFPEFEARTGVRGGPTAVMRMEHEQMRALLTQMRQALAGTGLEEFLGLGETLNILIQQHNMKEEHMLYPMADQALADSAQALIARMRDR